MSSRDDRSTVDEEMRLQAALAAARGDEAGHDEAMRVAAEIEDGAERGRRRREAEGGK